MSPHESEQNSTMFGHVDIMPIQGGTFIQRNTQIIATSSEQGTILWPKFDRLGTQRFFQV